MRPIGVRSERAGWPRLKTFLEEVHQAIRCTGGDPNRPGSAGKGSGRFNARGRGAAMAIVLKGRNAWSRIAVLPGCRSPQDSRKIGGELRLRRRAVKHVPSGHADIIQQWQRHERLPSGEAINPDRIMQPVGAGVPA